MKAHPVFWILLLLCASCGRNGEDPRRTLVYNCPANATEIETLKRELPSFTAGTGIVMTLNPFTGQEKLYAMMAAGAAPDIFYTNSMMRDRLAAEGRILDLRTVAAGDSFTSRLSPRMLATGMSVDSGWYSIPNWSYTLGVYYNRDRFDEAGIPYPRPEWTWEEMVRAARACTVDENGDGEPEHYGIFIGSHFVEAIELMNGAAIPPNALSATISPASAEAYRRYLSLMNDHLMPDLRRIQAMGMQAPQLLQGGKVAMLVEAVPHQMLIETLTVRWGVVPLPRFAGTPPRYFRTASGGLSVSASTGNPRDAWEGVKWLVSRASLYQPNPVLRDADFVTGWEARYPRLVGSGFREVWDLSLQYDGGDPRYFVRYSSWTSASILERLQPLLDRLWARELSVEELQRELPYVNERVERDLQDLLSRGGIRPAFRRSIEQSLAELRNGIQR
jgi:ABC-type glycerol-3-phosphate transport system substrate-binding protein